jgi:VanZ family protein
MSYAATTPQKTAAWLAQPRIALIVTVFLAIAIGIVTLTPSSQMPSAPGGDKLHHFLAFGLLALPMSFARPRAIWLIVLVAASYGALIEVIQPHIGRYGDLADAMANLTGAMMGSLIGVLLRRISKI